jgi:fatty acid desaturase
MALALLRSPIRGARSTYHLPQLYGRRRRRARLMRRLLFIAGIAVGAFVVAGLVWGVAQALRDE